ncbi:hypothetical protein, partial [Micromonospora sp. KC207]|uniref:hypothetical protein n=1 Tax=Micromonospora sp. KC207 TaxID=2530377 RepID=UPI001A9FF983
MAVQAQYRGQLVPATPRWRSSCRVLSSTWASSSETQTIMVRTTASGMATKAGATVVVVVAAGAVFLVSRVLLVGLSVPWARGDS